MSKNETKPTDSTAEKLEEEQLEQIAGGDRPVFADNPSDPPEPPSNGMPIFRFPRHLG